MDSSIFVEDMVECIRSSKKGRIRREEKTAFGLINSLSGAIFQAVGFAIKYLFLIKRMIRSSIRNKSIVFPRARLQNRKPTLSRGFSVYCGARQRSPERSSQNSAAANVATNFFRFLQIFPESGYAGLPSHLRRTHSRRPHRDCFYAAVHWNKRRPDASRPKPSRSNGK